MGGLKCKMASIAAREVARAVIKEVERGGRPSIIKIAPKKGYSIRTAQSGKIQKTKTFQKEIFPIVASLEIERRRAIEMLPKRIKKAKYRDLVDGIDKFTKNLQLLTGGATQNIALSVRKLSDDELERIANGGEKGIGE